MVQSSVYCAVSTFTPGQFPGLEHSVSVMPA